MNKRDLHVANVPIVGGQRTTMVCAQGHVDVLEKPMVYTLAPDPGQRDPLAVMICRPCMVEFLRGMCARPATPDELQMIAEQRAKEEVSNAKAQD